MGKTTNCHWAGLACQRGAGIGIVSRMSLKFKATLCAILFAMATDFSLALETVNQLFRNWTTRDGLPNNRVRSVIRSNDGFIWLATDAGAVRFDGAKFKLFGLREGLLAPIALELRETADGTLWIGTLGGGLSVLKDGRIRRTYTTSDGLPSNWISSLSSDADGLLIAWTRNGPARFEEGRFVPLVESSENPLPPTSILRDADGSRWAHQGSKNILKWEDGRWQTDPDGPQGPVALTTDLHGRLHVCDNQQLWIRTDDKWHAIPLPEAFKCPITSMTCAPDGMIWFATNRRGLLGWRDGTFVTPAPTFAYEPDLVETVSTTSDGQTWITSANGLYRMAPQTIQVSEIDDPLAPRASNNLGGLVESAPGTFIVATQGSGYYRWEDGHATRLSQNPDLGTGVYGNAIIKASDGNIWLGGDRSLFVLRGDGELTPLALPSPNIWCIYEGKQALWVGTSWGKLFRVKSGSIEEIDFKSGKEPIKAITEEADGTLWVGTRGNGLFRGKDGVWERFGRESGLVSEVIRTVYLDPKNRLWVGSDGGGLSMRLGRRFVTATTREGLPSDTVSQIFCDDDGRLWVGTHQGLAVFENEDIERFEGGHPSVLHPLLMNRADGLSNDEFTIVPPFKTSDGSIAFATINGFIRIDPRKVSRDTSRPHVYIERITSNGTDRLPEDGQISLPAGTRRLEIEFSGLFFNDPERLQFRNRLTEIEKDWQYVGNQQTAEYRNLAPGSYQFEVETSTGNGLWSSRPATLELQIEPHIWQTLWFRIIAVLASIILVGWIVRARERRRAHVKIEALRRRKAVDAERARIARDLHDDIGASLTQMALQSQLVERNLIRQPERAGNYVREIFNTARQMTRSLDEIVWAVNPGNDVLDNFVSFLASFVQDFAEGAGLRTRFDLPDTVPKLPVTSTVRHHLYLATKEILHNVVKHARASEVTMRVTLEEDTCVILISDNGCGAEEMSGEPGEDGLHNLENRFAELRGSCTRRSEPGVGTTVEMRFPLKPAHG